MAGNNLEQALTGASSPYVAGIIKQMTEGNEPAHLMAHAVWGAIVANAKDSNVAAGAIGAATAEGLAPYIVKYLYPGREIKDLAEEEKQKVVALATIGAGLAGSFGSDGNFASGVAAAETGKNAVENNLLSNQEGVKNLDEKGKALYEKLKEAGIGDIDDLQEEYESCNGDTDCQKVVRDKYRAAEDAAGQKILSLYQSEVLSTSDLDTLFTSYGYYMMMGSCKGGCEWGNINDLSAIAWTPAGMISNPYLSSIRAADLVSQWKAQGVSNEVIEQRLLRDEAFKSYLSPIDAGRIIELIDKGATKDEVVRFAAGIVLSGVINKAQNSVANAGKGEVSNTVVKGSLTGKPSKIYEQSTPDNQRSIKRENESARILANNGYNVEQNPVSTNTKNPDYKINGEIFDNYAPTTNNPRNIWTAVKTKVKEEQTQNVVINLADSKVNIDALKKQFVDWKIEGLNKIVIINKYHDIIKLQ